MYHTKNLVTFILNTNKKLPCIHLFTTLVLRILWLCVRLFAILTDSILYIHSIYS